MPKQNYKTIHAETAWQWMAIFSVFSLLMATIIWVALDRNSGEGRWVFGIYSTLLLMYLFMKMGLAFLYRPVQDKRNVDSLSTLRISAFIPNYNEPAEALVQTIHSLMRQTRVPDEVFVIDDGSPNPQGYEAARALTAQYPNLIVHRMEKNGGKRRAQGWAFRQASGDLFLTVDSDTQYDPEAVEAMIEPFIDPAVMAVGGQIRASNRTDNLLTMLLDMRYHNAYRVERAAQSVSGAMLCCSGPIAMYRREVVMDNLEDYENQIFLGEVVTAGDDRRLTQYALRKGKVKYQSTATCETTVPNSVRVFIRQQVRWTKSFFRESGESLRFALEMKRGMLLFWTLLELLLWIVFTGTVLYTLLIKQSFMDPDMWAMAVLYVALAAYARNVFYILTHPGVFMLAPMYGIFHLVVLFPVRMYALLTLKNTGWGTR